MRLIFLSDCRVAGRRHRNTTRFNIISLSLTVNTQIRSLLDSVIRFARKEDQTAILTVNEQLKQKDCVKSETTQSEATCVRAV